MSADEILRNLRARMRALVQSARFDVDEASIDAFLDEEIGPLLQEALLAGVSKDAIWSTWDDVLATERHTTRFSN
jgi:hypothetical protein